MVSEFFGIASRNVRSLGPCPLDDGIPVNNHCRQVGKEHVKALQETMRGNPTPPTTGEVVEELTEGEILSGYGVVRLITREGDETFPIELEMRNPIVKASTGTTVSFVLAYWEGALSVLLGKTLDATDITYAPNTDILKCRFENMNG